MGRERLVVGAFVAAIFLLYRPDEVVSKDMVEVGGDYHKNTTLFWMDGPFKATRPINVHPGANLTIQEGVEIYFDPGVGIFVQGILHAYGYPNFRIRLLPSRSSPEFVTEDTKFPSMKLVDGPSTMQGRLHVLQGDRWRAVCTMNTNWTDTDYSVACKTMGFGGGGFYKWYRRNNDTYPLVMPLPHCRTSDTSLLTCPSWKPSQIRLGENLCQGEDDLGLWCWGPPTFSGYEHHWRGIEFVDAPREPIFDDPNGISVKMLSKSRLEWVDILHAGWDKDTRNTTAALYAHGTPPIMNYVDIMYSAGDGVRFFESVGPVEITNSTISYNRGHGVCIDNSTDGRVFINETRIEFNFGDGVQYSMKMGMLFSPPILDGTRGDYISYSEPDRPEYNFCTQFNDPFSRHYYPRIIEAHLTNGTIVRADTVYPCHTRLDIKDNLQYTFTVQFLEITDNNNPALATRTKLIFCDRGSECQYPKYSIPVINGIIPQSIVTQNTGYGLWMGLKHEGAPEGKVSGDVRVVMRVFAQVKDQVMYGLNITNSRVTSNYGKGVFAWNVRDKVVINNVTISGNQHLAGLHILGGACDIWINRSRIDENWGDGVNISYVGGSIYVNGTSISGNRWRGIAFHYNDSYPFMPFQQQIVIRGRQANSDYTPTLINNNAWGGILVGNFCAYQHYRVEEPRVSINYITLNGNQYHPAFEYHSCRRDNQNVTVVEVIGTECSRSTGMCIRIEPAVNIKFALRTSKFLENTRPVVLIRNRQFPQLSHLPADVNIVEYNEWAKNDVDQFVCSVGLNENAPNQRAIITSQNSFRDNKVRNPYPTLNPRNKPYAVLIVSSSNVQVHQTCFDDPEALYELATDLDQHSKVINAEMNSWGGTGSNKDPKDVLNKIYDSRRRYNLATLDVDPYLRYCNFLSPDKFTPMLGYFLPWRMDNNRIGGQIIERSFLSKGRYFVVDDLHILPGASLDLDPGTVLEFEDSIGMLVQGELRRAGSNIDLDAITFTAKKFRPPSLPNIRLVNEEGESVNSGRLEVNIDNQWGSVCNRSWNLNLAGKACNMLGMTIDPEFLENYWLFPKPGELPVIMDIIRCEELETDITKCRHDGVSHNVNMSCRPIDVVGLRCIPPNWAGVRYSLLANPPVTTGQEYIHHLVIEKAGLFDYAAPQYTAALQIDWNYHVFRALTIRDNFWNGLDIVYNDLVRKPKIVESKFIRNRRHGVQVRSLGLTMDNCEISDNEVAGFRYNPILSRELHTDVVTWLDSTNVLYNNVYNMPNGTGDTMTLDSSDSTSGRKFLVARYSPYCGVTPDKPCSFDLKVFATNIQNGLEPKIGIQVISRPSNLSDEEVMFVDGDKIRGKVWSLRNNLINFPLVTTYNQLTIHYTRSFGPPSVILLLFFMDSYQYLDPFIHIQDSKISGNQYGISTIHYSNFTHWDGSIVNRHDREQMWFQRLRFIGNRQTVIWVNGPLRDVHYDSPISQIWYYVDNCTVTGNNGSIIETHKDLHSSANVFWWTIYKSYFTNNDQSGFSVTLPDTYDKFTARYHKFELMECEFAHNTDFLMELDGYYTWCNISANNFTNNRARDGLGIFRIAGMEKSMVMERNRWLTNKGRFMLLFDIQSQTIRMALPPAKMQFNVMDQNYYLSADTPHVDHFPRSFGFAILGLQRLNISFNYFRNPLMDFEGVVGLRGSSLKDVTNCSYNYWGVSQGTEVVQRIFDFDDWNIYSVAEFNPFYVNDVQEVISWWWIPSRSQVDRFDVTNPSIDDLKGRLFDTVTLERRRTKWTTFPYHYKPDRPYIIRRDLTIMPGATLIIEKGVEVHLYPNVRILVLGTLIAEGTYNEPIRFVPINQTEVITADPGVLNNVPKPPVFLPNLQSVLVDTTVNNQTSTRSKRDIIYRKFPLLQREDTFYQKFDSFLIGGPTEKSGWLEIWNATTGERVPICDRQFTERNAQVLCREKGWETQNAYVWVGPRYDRDPKVHITKFFSEPRQCTGFELRLSDCDLRLNSDKTLWVCVDPDHYVYIHCGLGSALEQKYVGAWGGISFSAPSLEEVANDKKPSVLRYVEIVGAGFPHNETGSALEMIYQSPILDHVNVTNSSFHGVNIVAPRTTVTLTQVNVTHNLGIGLNILTLNLQRPSDTTNPVMNITFPYRMFGITEMCSAGKEVIVENRILVFFKYDNFPVDCVKVFVSRDRNQKVAWKFLQANLFNSGADQLDRQDWLRFYSTNTFDAPNEIAFAQFDSKNLGATKESTTNTLGVYFRANAADGRFGFIAEVVVMPFPLDTGAIQEVNILYSRFQHNDRGAIQYSSMGEQNPNLMVDSCFVAHNGYNVWGNFSTTNQAIKLLLHNTQSLKFYNNLVWRNQGGLHVRAGSSTSAARLEGVIRNSAFSGNQNFEALLLDGRDYQKVFIINSYFGKNWAPYRDTVYVNRMITNFTYNVFYNNSGQHIIDVIGYPRLITDYQSFYNNYMFDNIAFGHGYWFNETFGFKADVRRVFQRTKRQSSPNVGTSFEWWAFVGSNTERYRSTILVGTPQQHFERNFFVNPLNDFELTTTNKSESEFVPASVDARSNYWGFPGTVSSAAGRVMDQEDYKFLIPVDYSTTLSTNVTLLDHDCPPGWFLAGQEEPTRIKSCFLFVGGATPYHQAVQFCRDNDAYMPYFRHSDPRIGPISEKLSQMSRKFLTSFEKYYVPSPGNEREVRVWVSGVMVPPDMCGSISSATGKIGFYNCEFLLPFVCEKDPDLIKDPFLLRPGGIAAVVLALIAVLIIVILIVLWYVKSRRRKQEFFERKNSLRDSLRSVRLQAERNKEKDRMKGELEVGKRPPSPDEDLIRRGIENILNHPSTANSTKHTSPSMSSQTDSSSLSGESSSQPRSYQPRKMVVVKTSKNSLTKSSAYSESAYRSGSEMTDGSTRTDSTKRHVNGRDNHYGRSAPNHATSLSSFKTTTSNTGGYLGSMLTGVSLRKQSAPVLEERDTIASSYNESNRPSHTDTNRTSATSTMTDTSTTMTQRSDSPPLSSARSSSTVATEEPPPAPLRSKGAAVSNSSIENTDSSVGRKVAPRSRAPYYYPGSTGESLGEENLNDYKQQTISPTQLPRKPLPPRPPPSHSQSGAKLPPPTSYTNLACADTSVSTDSLISGLSSRNNSPHHHQDTSKSVPNLSQFLGSRNNSADTSGVLSGARGFPLETAM